jgi:hypothetical protein
MPVHPEAENASKSQKYFLFHADEKVIMATHSLLKKWS